MPGLPLAAGPCSAARCARRSSRRARRSSAGDSRRPSLDRRQTMSSALQAHSSPHQIADLGLRQCRRRSRGRDRPSTARVAEQIARARAVGAHQAAARAPRTGTGSRERVRATSAAYAVDREIAAGQRLVRGPALPSRGCRQIRRELLQRLLGQPAIGGDLAAEDRQQRRAARRVELEHVVAGRRLGLAGAVVVERAHAGEGPDHVGRRHRLGEICADRVAEIGDLLRRRLHLRRIAVVIAVGGADQREVALDRGSRTRCGRRRSGRCRRGRGRTACGTTMCEPCTSRTLRGRVDAGRRRRAPARPTGRRR